MSILKFILHPSSGTYQKYIFSCFIILFTSSSPCRKDQFAVSYSSTSLIVLIQVYSWEIWHHSLLCCCGLADILYTRNLYAPGLKPQQTVKKLD